MSIHEQQLQHCIFDANKTNNLRENRSALNSPALSLCASHNLKMEEEDDDGDMQKKLTLS